MKRNSSKIFGTFIILQFLVFGLFAQVSVNAGIRAGVNFSSVAFNDELDTLNSKVLAGHSINFVMELGFGKFSIQPELAFIRKGDKIDESIELDFEPFGTSTITIKRKVKMNYIEIPVLLKYDLVKIEEVDFQVYAGPTFGFLQSHSIEGEVTVKKVTHDAGGGDILETTSENLDHETNLDTDTTFDKSEVGLALGLTGRVKAGPGKLSLDIRLATGLTPYQTYTTNGVKNELSNKNTTISIGYIFPLTGK